MAFDMGVSICKQAKLSHRFIKLRTREGLASYLGLVYPLSRRMLRLRRCFF